ncbi:MAG: hypothetical protein KUA29_09895, partial [Methanobacterium sp.]|nr:hypothetical protein [Methanobacterium sp.]
DNKLWINESLKQRNLADADWALANLNMSDQHNLYNAGTDNISKVKAQILHTWGTKDITVPEYMIKDNVKALEKRSKLVVYENCGHSPLVDVPDVEAVFNHDVPNDTEYYVHRIGRTGRAGKKGRSFTFVSGKEIYKLRDIQRYTKTKIKQERIPSVGDIEKIKIDLVLEKIKNSIQNDNLDTHIHTVEGLIEIGFNSLDISAALLKIIKEKEL